MEFQLIHFLPQQFKNPDYDLLANEVLRYLNNRIKEFDLPGN